ncbi:hypothetical protein HCU64_18175 [Methylobacterium sp. C25]|uniref:hypothetical protein n=1 Tax=Methylobacterium sp. C25 TaxID=2721622 RepID=UPI001F2640A5|nr:hypothetical protein [Methylobacterium sp. C25]MCE4225683.1 hypothetical protein [Methylobacterium sp. C25]
MQPPDPRAVRIQDKASAEAFIASLMATMHDLDAVLASESEGVRAGRIREAMVGGPRKAELASAYLNGLEAAKSNAIALARFAPNGIESLKAAHRRFAAVVETNQTVLATARTVSEGLIRTLADELGKSGTPTVYGRPSTPPSPYGRNAGRGPLLLSRSL